MRRASFDLGAAAASAAEAPPGDRRPSSDSRADRPADRTSLDSAPGEGVPALTMAPPGVGDEIQITDAIGLLNKTQPVTGYAFSEGRYDCGKPLDYLKATVEIGAMRDDLGPAFRQYLKDFVATLD